VAQPNDSEQPNDTTFDELFRPLEGQLEQHEQVHPSHHRETFHFKDFVRLLVYHFTEGCESGRLLLSDRDSAEEELELPEVKRSTFFDAFQRFPAEWFIPLVAVLLTTVAWIEIPDLATLGRLICVDGSVFPGVANMLWAAYTSKHKAIRLHLCFELNRMLPAHFLVDTGNSNEKKALLQMLEAGVTYIADRGYLSFALLSAIAAAEAFFVVRAKVNLVYKRVQKLPVDLPSCVQHLFSHVSDQRIRLENAKGRPIQRLVKFWVGEEQYLILTNRLDLTTFQVILLYAYRWQVELVFRFLKRSLNGLHLLSQSENGVTIHFYALLITALLELRLKQQCVAACDLLLANQDSPTEAEQPAVAGLMVDPERLMGARGNTFLATIGEKLHRYWKISKHWLVTLQNYLARPFDQQVIAVLGSL
jgi:Transposase DDE domain